MNKPLFPLLGQLASQQADPETVELPDEASPLDFLTAVYRSPVQPIGRRLTAAIAALPFVHPKLAVTANTGVGNFAEMMEEIARQSGKPNVIDAKANYRTLPEPTNSRVADPTGR